MAQTEQFRGSMFVLLVSTLLLSGIATEVENDHEVGTTCDIPAVRVQQPTNLTCKFYEDMDILQKNIKVIHSYKGKEETVLLCYWNDGRPNCQGNHGILFSGVLRNRLVITITHAAQKHVGDYRCKVIGSNESDETCTFILKGIQANCSIPQVEYGRKTNLSCIFSENVALSRTDFQIIHTPFNNGDEARIIIKCMWDGETPHCIEDKSYNFTYTITEMVRLRIDYATSYHAGTYSCNALINSEENAGNCTFIPFYLPYLANLTINGYSEKKLLKQNESVNVVCEWKNGNPPTTARLLKNNLEKLAESNISGKITYDIPEVQCRDAGTIKCVIGDTDQLTVSLLVECPPEFMSTSAEMQNITIGHMFRIQVPVRTHTTELIRCEIIQLLNPSRTNYSDVKIVKNVNTKTLECSTSTGSHKEECICSLTGSPPDLTFILYLLNVREEYNGVWQARINNGIGTGQVTLSFHVFQDHTVTSELKNTSSTTPILTEITTSPKINDSNDMDSTILGIVALICAMLAVTVSCVKVKLTKGHLLRRTVNEYEEVDTQSVMSVCRTTTANVVLVHSASVKNLSAPFPIINLGSSLPNVSNDETYSCLQLK